MNKWKRRFREQIHLLEVRVSQYEGIHQQLSNAKQECDAALNKVEELRHDAVRLATELARVQGECEGAQAQVLKHSATIVNLRERENEALKESEGLLAWERRVREEWKECDECTAYNARLRQAIEAEAEPKEET